MLNRILLGAAALVLLAAPSPAQQLNTETKTITGVVETTTWARPGPPLYTYLKIVVVSDSGQKVECFVMKGTDQIATDGSVDHGNAVIKGQHVEVTYTTISGGNEFLNGANAAVSLKHLD